MNHLDFLKVYTNSWGKKRIGNVHGDGGYVVVDIPDARYDILLSGGIDRDISFEVEFVNLYNTKCVAFDHTINNLPWESQNITWVKKAISHTNTENSTNLIEYIEQYNNIFLKMDVEGGEYDLFSVLPETCMQKIDQIVVEYHYPWGNQHMMNIIEKVNNTHTILHAHANNCCNLVEYGGVIVPQVFELTYVRKSLLNGSNITSNTLAIPSSHDRPNIIGKADWELNHYPFVW